MMKFKEVADALAKEQGLTNTEVAEMIGMSKANYSHEKGHNDNLSLYLKVCDALGADICIRQPQEILMIKYSINKINDYFKKYCKTKNSAVVLLQSVSKQVHNSIEAHYQIVSKAGKKYNFTTINK